MHWPWLCVPNHRPTATLCHIYIILEVFRSSQTNSSCHSKAFDRNPIFMTKTALTFTINYKWIEITSCQNNVTWCFMKKSRFTQFQLMVSTSNLLFYIFLCALTSTIVYVFCIKRQWYVKHMTCPMPVTDPLGTWTHDSHINGPMSHTFRYSGPQSQHDLKSTQLQKQVGVGVIY